MSVSLEKMLEIAHQNATEALEDGNIELAGNALDVLIHIGIQLIELDSLADELAEEAGRWLEGDEQYG